MKGYARSLGLLTAMLSMALLATSCGVADDLFAANPKAPSSSEAAEAVFKTLHCIDGNVSASSGAGVSVTLTTRRADDLKNWFKGLADDPNYKRIPTATAENQGPIYEYVEDGTPIRITSSIPEGNSVSSDEQQYAYLYSCVFLPDSVEVKGVAFNAKTFAVQVDYVVNWRKTRVAQEWTRLGLEISDRFASTEPQRAYIFRAHGGGWVATSALSDFSFHRSEGPRVLE